MKSYMYMKYEQFKAKFQTFCFQRKKVKALENFGDCSDFEGKRFLPFLKEILKNGILDDQEEAFVDHQISKIQIDALSWSHRTKWLKGEMRRMKADSRVKIQNQLYLPLEMPKKAPINIPSHLIQKATPGSRVVRL